MIVTCRWHSLLELEDLIGRRALGNRQFFLLVLGVVIEPRITAMSRLMPSSISQGSQIMAGLLVQLMTGTTDSLNRSSLGAVKQISNGLAD